MRPQHHFISYMYILYIPIAFHPIFPSCYFRYLLAYVRNSYNIHNIHAFIQPRLLPCLECFRPIVISRQISFLFFSSCFSLFFFLYPIRERFRGFSNIHIIYTCIRILFLFTFILHVYIGMFYCLTNIRLLIE